MSKHRSINERLRATRKNDTKREIMREWSQNVTIRTNELCNLVYNAVETQDMDGVRESLTELVKLIKKSMDAVPRITDELIKTQPDTQDSE